MHAVAHIFARSGIRIGRHANYGADFGAGRDVDARAEMLGEIAGGGQVFNDAIADRPHEIQMEAMPDGFIAKKNGRIIGQERVNDAFLRVTDYGRDNFFEEKILAALNDKKKHGAVKASDDDKKTLAKWIATLK